MRTPFVTSRGHAYAVFRRAVDRGNATAELAAAADLPYVGLTDALELCLLLRDDGARFERAIVRWQARYGTETAGVTVEEAQAVLALLAALRGARGPTAARSLAELLDRRGLERASEALIRWFDEHERQLASSGASELHRPEKRLVIARDRPISGRWIRRMATDETSR